VQVWISVYFYSLHVSGSHVPVIRRINCINTRSGGSTSFEDAPRQGRPKSATPPEISEQVHDMVLDDRRMKVREIAETTRIGISKERVGYILHEELDMKKLC
jgi:hypothetical protein